MCNSPERFEEHFLIASRLRDPRVSAICTFDPAPYWDCYWSAEWAVSTLPLISTWLCCASDDSYYCPEFVERMTDVPPEIDLVYCDILYDRRWAGWRKVMPSAPIEGSIDKTSFIVRRSRWIGFPDKRDGVRGTANADGRAVEEMARREYRMRHIPEPLVIHN